MNRPTLVLIGIAATVIALSFAIRSETSDGPGAQTPPPEQTQPPTTLTTTTTTAPEQTLQRPTSTSVAPAFTLPLPEDVVICDLYTQIATTGTVETASLVEASGLAASRASPGVLWSHNDSRGTPTLYAFTDQGVHLGSFDVPDAFAFDWEDISNGPDSSGEGTYLYIGDIGDNFGIRSGRISVYRVEDADPSTLGNSFATSVRFEYSYPNGTFNAEALFIDPVEPALYIVTKDRDSATVFRGSLRISTEVEELVAVEVVQLGGEVTAADMSFDGTALVFRGYETVWMWHRITGESVADMLANRPCLAPPPIEIQGESITFDASGSYWTVSEGSHSAIQSVERLDSAG